MLPWWEPACLGYPDRGGVLLLVSVVFFPPLSFLSSIYWAPYARHAYSSLRALTTNLFNYYESPPRSREASHFRRVTERKWWRQEPNSGLLTREPFC